MASSRAPGATPNQVQLRPPVHRLATRAIGWWALRAAALVASLLLGLGLGYALAEPARPVLGPALIVGSVLGMAYLVVMPAWRYLVHRWEHTEHAVYAATGWVVREWRVAPVSRIQTVDTTRGPLEQLFGLSTLAITTASSHGTIYIPGLDHQVAQAAAARLTTLTEQTPGDAT